jgi:hypothetical protein
VQMRNAGSLDASSCILLYNNRVSMTHESNFQFHSSRSVIPTLMLFPVFAVFVSINLGTPYLVSIVLFYGMPGIYLGIRYGYRWQFIKGFLFALTTSIPFAIIVDYVGISSGVWYTPKTIFPMRFLGVIPFEDFFWLISATFTIAVIYEILVDRGKHEIMDRRMLYFFSLTAPLLCMFFLIPEFTRWSIYEIDSQYTYLALGILFFLLPAVLFLLRYSLFLKRSLPLIGYFLYLTFCFEISAIHLRQWIFSGRYILSPIKIIGNVYIPLEELFFVGIIGPLAVIAFYEFFDDDRR